MMKLNNVGGTTPMLDGTRMVDFLNRLKSLPWANGDDHEARVGEILDEYGIHYTYQPNGTQNYPDYEIPTRWGIINLECKSNKNAKPMYNSGRPHADGLYVFTSQKYNETTLFWGDDILSLDKRELYDRMLLEMKDVLVRYQALPEWQDERGFDFYLREMYTQSGTAEYTDYFIHKDRTTCEQNVFNFFK